MLVVSIYLTVSTVKVKCDPTNENELFSFGGVNYLTFLCIEASRGTGTQSVTVKTTGSGFDPHSRR